MNLRHLAGVLLVSLTLMACQDRDEPEPPPAARPEQAAQQGLDDLKVLATTENYRDLGFEALADVGRAQLGRPMEIFNVGLRPLQAFGPGVAPRSLLLKSSETIYPLTVDGSVRSSLSIARVDGGYAPSSFGSAEIVRQLSVHRRDAAGASDFVVHVPALKLHFLGRLTGADLVLVPIFLDPRVPFAVGQPEKAEVIFGRLVPYARASNGLPG